MRIFALLILVQSAISLAGEVPKLSELSAQLAPRASLPLSSKISLEIASNTSAELAERLAQFKGVVVTAVAENTVTITLIERPHALAPVGEEFTRNSFVIDFEEQSVIDFVDAFKSRQSEATSWQDLPVYVSEFIDQPTYIHGFNIASVVAKDRSGDCTEYAVLTSALARAIGLPSRVVFGAVILENSDNLEAFGHAWTEIWQDGSWHVADAALVDAEGVKKFYLPTGVLDNEGPGYAMSLIGAVRFLPAEIRNIKSIVDDH